MAQQGRSYLIPNQYRAQGTTSVKGSSHVPLPQPWAPSCTEARLRCWGEVTQGRGSAQGDKMHRALPLAEPSHNRSLHLAITATSPGGKASWRSQTQLSLVQGHVMQISW